MRALLEVMQFEIRYQLRSPFFLGALLMFALIHFMSITGAVIHIDISNQVAINSAYAILQIELALFIFGMLPIVAFVTTAITRDFEHATASLLFVTPISPKTFVLGRFLGALSLALLIGLAGLLGAMIGTFMPWLDQERIAPFSLLPWAYIFLCRHSAQHTRLMRHLLQRRGAYPLLCADLCRGDGLLRRRRSPESLREA